MFTRISVLCLLLPLGAARSQPDPATTVRGYFAALGRNDFQGALSLTEGAAQERTAHMVGTLREQAAAHSAKVELKVKRVEVSPPANEAEANGTVPVEVRFDIDVVGKKWLFHKVARTLAGKAQFYVNEDAARIVAIEGNLE
jgi:hypothetical protein